jgi:hypothetical protein
MVVTLILVVGVLLISVVFYFAPSHRPPNSESIAPVLVADAVDVDRSDSEMAPANPPVSLVRPSAGSTPVPAAPRSVEDRWGLQITGMRLAFGGKGLDLRYKVLDPAKATNLLHMQGITYIIDQASGKSIPLPFQRENQTSQKLVAGKTYFALLSNKGQVVKQGSKVTVVIGNSREKDVMIE